LRSGTTSYYESDGLVSVTSLSSSAGALANTYTYDSFGNVTNSAGTLHNPFSYTARESDTETGLYYYRARYYDPILGRFTREDPRKEVVRGLNFYVYVRNSPLNFIDPDGRDPCGWLCQLWKWLKLGKNTYDPAKSTMDWSLCGVYYVTCLEVAYGINADLAQTLNSNDPVVSGTAYATLQQQVGGSNAGQVALNACIHNNENCKKALECAEKGFTNPLPFPRF
jgi:RHS repeat-associated protein